MSNFKIKEWIIYLSGFPLFLILNLLLSNVVTLVFHQKFSFWVLGNICNNPHSEAKFHLSYFVFLALKIIILFLLLKLAEKYKTLRMATTGLLLAEVFSLIAYGTGIISRYFFSNYLLFRAFEFSLLLPISYAVVTGYLLFRITRKAKTIQYIEAIIFSGISTIIIILFCQYIYINNCHFQEFFH